MQGFPGTKKPSYIEPAKKNRMRANLRVQAEKGIARAAALPPTTSAARK